MPEAFANNQKGFGMTEDEVRVRLRRIAERIIGEAMREEESLGRRKSKRERILLAFDLSAVALLKAREESMVAFPEPRRRRGGRFPEGQVHEQ